MPERRHWTSHIPLLTSLAPHPRIALPLESAYICSLTILHTILKSKLITSNSLLAFFITNRLNFLVYIAEFLKVSFKYYL